MVWMLPVNLQSICNAADCRGGQRFRFLFVFRVQYVVNVCGNCSGGLWEEAVKRIPAMYALKVRCCMHQL